MKEYKTSFFSKSDKDLLYIYFSIDKSKSLTRSRPVNQSFSYIIVVSIEESSITFFSKSDNYFNNFSIDKSKSTTKSRTIQHQSLSHTIGVSVEESNSSFFS